MTDTELIQMLVDVVNDFMPNIGNCALQDYGRLNLAMIEADKRLLQEPEEISK
jgi:hypothetical protein